MTMTFEAGVAALFRNVVEENIELRRSLLQAGLSPPAPRAERPGWLPTAHAPVIPRSPKSQEDTADMDFADHHVSSMSLQPKVRVSCGALDPLNLRGSRRLSGRTSGRLSDRDQFRQIPSGGNQFRQISSGGNSDLGSRKPSARISEREMESARPSRRDSSIISGISESDKGMRSYPFGEGSPRSPGSPVAVKQAQNSPKVKFADRTASVLEGMLVDARASMPHVGTDDSMVDGSTLWSDDGGSQRPRKKVLKMIVRSFAFESFISACIIANCGTVGVWAHHMVTNNLSEKQIHAVESSEHVFVAIFTLELLLKWTALGWKAYKPIDPYGRSNFMDMMLVVFTGIVLIWLVPLFMMLASYHEENGALKTLVVLRTVRLARLVRVFQRVPLFREAWLLINGLTDSSRTLFWTCFSIFLITYIFAIVGLATIVVELESLLSEATDPTDIANLSSLVQMTGGLDKMMALLVQVLMTDSFHAFTRQILDYITWSWIFWYAYIAIANIVLMNLVTAIIVENAIESSKADRDHIVHEKERNRQRDIDRMRKVFVSMDTDGGGTLSWEEFSRSFDDEELSKTWKVLDIDQKEAWELFQLLDDGDGEITINDFMEALQRMSGVAQAKDMFRLQKMLGFVMNSLDTMSARDIFNLRRGKQRDED